jgi:alkaline phosphatase
MAKGNYVDGFVLTIPKQKAAAYKKMAKEASTIWKKYGALDYKECVIDDATPPGVVTTFAKMAKSKPGEEVWFSYVVYKSRAHRDAVNKKVMAYFEKKYDEKSMKDMPFDMKRMAYGGFKVAVSS